MYINILSNPQCPDIQFPLEAVTVRTEVWTGQVTLLHINFLEQTINIKKVETYIKYLTKENNGFIQIFFVIPFVCKIKYTSTLRYYI